MEETFWQLILKLRHIAKNSKEPIQHIFISLEGTTLVNPHAIPNQPGFWVHLQPQTISSGSIHAHFLVESPSKASVIDRGTLSETTCAFLKQYLPYCLSCHFAKAQQKAISIAHFAQSLDGRIATANGDSKWIGNTENLIHAHRMRALSDAILIGSGTLKKDQPKLTVRLVNGPNPKRIVLGTSAACYSSLYESSKDRIMVIGRHSSSLNGQIDYVQLEPEKEFIDPHHILQNLYQQGICSVYIEGGSTTTSYFIKRKAINILQLHLAPLLLGGGTPCLQIPGIDLVDQAIRFEKTQFQPTGDAIMFVGELATDEV